MEQECTFMDLDVSVARFEPMRRLLSGEDEAYLRSQGLLREAAELRAQHRKLFFRFIDMLEKDFKRVQNARKMAMASQHLDLETLLRDRLKATYCLWALRGAATLHFMRLPRAGETAERVLEQLLPATQRLA